MIAEHCLLSSMSHVTFDALWFFWNADNRGALKCALRDIAKCHVKLESITRVTFEYCHEQDYMFIFIQRVLGVSVYTECCSIATSKTICLSSYREFQECQCIQSVALLPRAKLSAEKIYRVFQECQCRQSVGELPRARICIYVYTVFHVCHECTECCSVATSKNMCLCIHSVSHDCHEYTECCSVAISTTVLTYTQSDPVLPWWYRVFTYFHEQDCVFMYIQRVPRLSCIYRVLQRLLLLTWTRLFKYVQFVSFFAIKRLNEYK